MNRIVLPIIVFALAIPNFSKSLVAQISTGSSTAGQSIQSGPSSTTPFTFIQRADVINEVGVTSQQTALVDQFQPICDSLCQAAKRQQLDSMPEDLRQLYSGLSYQQRLEAEAFLEQDLRESIELGTLRNQVLTSQQMGRFEQIWTQQSGLGGLLSGNTSRLVGVSESQKSDISQIQDLSNQAVNACLANPNLTPAQQDVQIQQIQNVTINQCINVLSDDQVATYVGLCGEKFDPAGKNDPGNGDQKSGDPESGDIPDDGEGGPKEDNPDDAKGDPNKDDRRDDGQPRGDDQRDDRGRENNRSRDSNGDNRFGPERIAGNRPNRFGSNNNNQARKVRGFGPDGGSSNRRGVQNQTRNSRTGSGSSTRSSAGNSRSGSTRPSSGPTSNSNARNQGQKK